MVSVVHGKVILGGEHAVVYEKPGLAGPLRDIRVEADSRLSPDENIRLYTQLGNYTIPVEEARRRGEEIVETWKKCSERGDFSLLRELDGLEVLTTVPVYYLDYNGPPVEIELDSTIPLGAGCGSSAAAGVAVIRELARRMKREVSGKEIFETSLQCERMFHGNPSGIDTAVAVRDCAVLFQKGKGLEYLDVDPFEVIMVYTHPPEKSTRELVQQVREIPENVRDPIMREIGKIVEKEVQYLQDGDHRGLMECIKKNHTYLQQLRVTTSEINRLDRRINQEDDIALKLTGAGGGGMCLVVGNLDKAAEILEEMGYTETQPSMYPQPRSYWYDRIF
ncbi:MAG: mevalonate kinase [Candidatus Micrarchaeota archaeon]|nr:mevalonate kinase [Candidatus Micrarchaeota archaeon]